MNREETQRLARAVQYLLAMFPYHTFSISILNDREVLLTTYNVVDGALADGKHYLIDLFEEDMEEVDDLTVYYPEQG